MNKQNVQLPKPTFFSHDGENSEGIRNLDRQEWLSSLPDKWLLLIAEAGSSSWKRGEYWRRDKSQVCYIELVTAGDLYLSQNEKEYVVTPGQAYILHRGANHTYMAGPAGFVHKRYVWLAGPALDTLFQMSGLSGVDVVTVDDTAAVMRIMHAAKKILHEKPAQCEKQLSELAFRLVNELIASSFAHHPELVQKTIDFIQANPDRNLSNKAISSHAGVSSGYLIREFRRVMGQTPQEYHLRLRISIASRLLKMTDRRIKEIALKTGFEDPLYFSRIFKMNTGVSPREFRTAS